MKTTAKVILFAIVFSTVTIIGVSAQCCGYPVPLPEPEQQAEPTGGGPTGASAAGRDSLFVDYSPEQNFTVPTLRGEDFTLSEQLGKPVVIFAMAYWCPTCIPEAEALARIYEKYGDSVVILALDVDPNSTAKTLSTFREYVDNPGYFWGFDVGGRVTQTLGIRALETTIIFSRQGEIAYTDTRSTSYRTLDRTLQPLVRN